MKSCPSAGWEAKHSAITSGEETSGPGKAKKFITICPAQKSGGKYNKQYRHHNRLMTRPIKAEKTLRSFKNKILPAVPLLFPPPPGTASPCSLKIPARSTSSLDLAPGPLPPCSGASLRPASSTVLPPGSCSLQLSLASGMLGPLRQSREARRRPPEEEALTSEGASMWTCSGASGLKMCITPFQMDIPGITSLQCNA